MKLWKTLHSIHTSKVSKAIFKKYPKTMHENGEQAPSCLDCITSRWNSTIIIYQQSLKWRDVLIYTTSDKAIADVFVDHTISIEDWSHIKSMQQWLLGHFVPVRIWRVSDSTRKIVATDSQHQTELAEKYHHLPRGTTNIRVPTEERTTMAKEITLLCCK